MVRNAKSIVTNKFIPILLVLAFAAAQFGCGNQDYEKPIQQFQQAAAVVIASTRDFLKNMNQIEQEAKIDELTFDNQPIDLDDINKLQIITPEEIAVRQKALDALASYTSNLANLIQSKNTQAIADNTKSLQKSLNQLVQDSKSLPAPKVPGLDNARFSGAVQLAASALGSVAQVLAERKARREVETAILNNDKPINDLIQAIEQDVNSAYARQQSTLGAMGDEVINDYKLELEKPTKPNPVAMLYLSDRLKAYRAREVTLKSADPEPAIEAMRKAHSALVAYVASNKDPKTLSELMKSAEDFFNRAQPLGEAVVTLMNAK